MQKTKTPEIKKYEDTKPEWISVIIILLLTSVAMRALIGFSLQLDWKSIGMLGTLLTLAIFSGKFFGGFFGDKYGFMKTGLIGLAIATPLLVFFQEIHFIIYIGAFAFNLVMPITLTALANTLPNNKGFAFGLTTLALLVGYIMNILLSKTTIPKVAFTSLFLILNITTLYYGLKKYNKIKKTNYTKMKI